MYRYGCWVGGVDCPQAKELVVIAVELDCLGFQHGQVDLDLLGAPSGEAYATRLLEPATVSKLDKRFIFLFLMDIRRRLLDFPEPSRKRKAADSTTSSSEDELMDSTPRKSIEPKPVNTPMTVPHRTPAASVGGIDIIKLRDKYFARIPVFSEFIDTPRRVTRSDAESDLATMLREIENRKLAIENPSITDQERESIISHLKVYVESLALVQPSASGASTPQPEKRAASSVARNEDGTFSFSHSLYGKTFETPRRPSEKEAMDDWKRFEAELKRVRSLISVSKSSNVNHESVILTNMRRFFQSLPQSTQGIHRMRDKIYTSVDVMGTALTTPLRSNEAEVTRDREIVSEILRDRAAGVTREAIIAEIKSRWNLTNTPRKA
jgi:hypothetical protein